MRKLEIVLRNSWAAGGKKEESMPRAPAHYQALSALQREVVSGFGI